jgi:hypothetical protein
VGLAGWHLKFRLSSLLRDGKIKQFRWKFPCPKFGLSPIVDARVRDRVYSSASSRVFALAAVLSCAALPYSSSWQVRAVRLGRGVARVGGVRTATSVRKREWRRSLLLFARMRAVFRLSLLDRSLI